MVEEYKTVETDVLIVGGGGAGARAAIEASKQGVNITLVDKGPIGRMGLTTTGGGGFTVLESPPGKTFEQIFKENVEKGCYLNDQDLIEIWWKESFQGVEEFKSWGAKVGGGGGNYFIGGESMMIALRNEMARHPNITVLEDTIVTKLLTHGGKVAGATAMDVATGEFILVKAKCVILATGGLGMLYWPSEAAPLGIDPGVEGDGQVLAYHAGADIVNMEMVMFSFIPLNPKRVFSTRHFENFWEAGHSGPYTDKDGKIVISSEEILKSPCGFDGPDMYNPYVMRRLGEEMKKGPCYYRDVVAVKPGQTRQQPRVDEILKLDESEMHMMQIVPGCLTTMGGPRVNDKCETSVPGLYAAGEVIGNINGAFRSFTMLSQIPVTGRRAGAYAAEYAKKAKQIPIDAREVEAERGRVFGFLKPKSGGVSSTEVKKKVWEVTMKHLNVLRNGKGLQEAVAQIEKLKKEYLTKIQANDVKRFNLEWVDCLEVPVMLDAAEMVARFALFRTESRGCHYREDFPGVDNKNWVCHTLLKKKARGMEISKAPVNLTRLKPPV